MTALELLHTRQSNPRLIAPYPNEAQLDAILDAGARVPDHGGLTPWEFIIAKDDGLDKLAAIFVDALTEQAADIDKIDKAKKMPHRAPMVITVVAKTCAHPKVPVFEQQLTAGCAVMAMQQAAFAQGLGGIWRTGEMAFNDLVHAKLGLSQMDQIVGFLYLGTPAITATTKPMKSGRDFTRYL